MINEFDPEVNYFICKTDYFKNVKIQENKYFYSKKDIPLLFCQP